METQTVLLTEMHLAHLLDETMVSKKAMQSALLTEKRWDCLLAGLTETQTVLLREMHLVHLTDEMMASKKAL